MMSSRISFFTCEHFDQGAFLARQTFAVGVYGLWVCQDLKVKVSLLL